MNTSKEVHEFKAFNKEKYKREDIIPEFFALQREIVECIFGEDYSKLEEQQIEEVCKCFKERNAAKNNIADTELNEFESRSRELIRWFKSELSGRQGERMLFEELEKIKPNSYVIRNVELEYDTHITEIYALVINPKGITILEAKNCITDVHIDYDGYYCTTGKYLEKRCNLYNKMWGKKNIVESVLREHGIEGIEINELIVFTNDVKVVCDNNAIGKMLRYTNMIRADIDNRSMPNRYSDTCMKEIYDAITEARISEEYKVNFDIEGYKQAFKDLVAKLDTESEKTEKEHETLETFKYAEAKLNTEPEKKCAIPETNLINDGSEDWLVTIRNVALGIIFPPYGIYKIAKEYMNAA